MLRPTRRLPPDEWARQNRVYPPSAGLPGPREPSLTPYVVPFERAVARLGYKRYVLVMGAQGGKTDASLDLIGSRLDQRPAPIVYVGPSKEFLVDQFEPRLMGLLDEAATLSEKVMRGKRMKKTVKYVSGVQLRLAHAGSSTALKSNPAALAILDEYDEMLGNIRGQGEPLGLVEARGFTYADFAAVVTSTPSRGVVDTYVDEKSGLEFWDVAEPQDLESGTWRLFQEGTRYHWSWQCVHCDEYFIPRMKQLKWPEGCSPAEAKDQAWLECPHCGGVHHDEEHKAVMNERGRYVAPGQIVSADGEVHGEPPNTSTCSFWVSGLASPFVSWGERAESYLTAVASGDEGRVQTAVNAGFGECYALGLTNDVLDWQDVSNLAVPYVSGTVPREVLRLTAGVDVQKRSLWYVIRGWGAQANSWLIDAGQLFGPTHEMDVWVQLLGLLMREYDGLVVEKAMVDSGFRPGKAGAGDDHIVYTIARDYPWLILPTKGHDRQSTPIRAAQIEVKESGRKAPRSQTLYHLDSDFFKSLVHSRLRIAHGQAGSFYLPEDITEDYCRQLVSEWRAVSPGTNKAYWVVRNRNNHLLDCEALAAAAGFMLRVHTIPEGAMRDEQPQKAAATAKEGGGEASEIRNRYASLGQRMAR